MLAGVAMAMSSVTVVGNSILLGRYKPRFAGKKPIAETIYTSGDVKKAYYITTNFNLKSRQKKLEE